MNDKEFLQQSQDKLTTYLNAICKVHGKHHPELFEAKDSYHRMIENSDQSQVIKQELDALSQLTNDFEVPNDACQTYQEVYLFFKELQTYYN